MCFSFFSESESDIDADLDDLAAVVIEDEAEVELQSVLHRNRLIKQFEQKATVIPASEQVTLLSF